MDYTAAVITVSDRSFAGKRVDTGGPAVRELLSASGWDVIFQGLVPDEPDDIQAKLIQCADHMGVALVVTTGGTGFSPRDITPEATLAVVERVTPGIPEVMRAASVSVTPRGMLSRAVAGIRGQTLIVNLPGSEKAARECLVSVLPALKHGIDMLRGPSSDCAGLHMDLRMSEQAR
ncbi:MAG: MogA/MoaB family molybdenum cofactor biosynthesis protein [Oscillospiraceae bacterium]